MKRLDARVAELEQRAPGAHRHCHRVVQRVGMTREGALDAYGRGRIGSDDLVILRVIVGGAART